jgi:L-ascorbate metabolism protein UlaG (beta-lactamase superfamily)
MANSYQNLTGVTWTQPLLPLLRWRIGRRFQARTWRPGPEALPDVRPNDGSCLADRSAHLTWIGHATFVVRLGGVLVATDPIWSPRCVDLPRLRPPGVALDDLPGLDVVTVTHNHYDHCDIATLRRLAARFDPLFIVPAGVGRHLARAGAQRVEELQWWESRTIGELKITFVPAQHWSARTPFDINRTLWGGFVYEGPEGVAYHSGDTAYEPLVFEEIARRCPRIDWAMLPIGAYDPEWFLRTQHLDPEDSTRAFALLGARRFVAMHHGTFRLTDEPMDEPLTRCRAAFADIDALDRLWSLDIGETRRLYSSSPGCGGSR